MPVLVGCGQTSSSDITTNQESIVSDSITDEDLDLAGDWQFADYWLVVADTSTDYWQLNTLMFQLSDQLTVEIDTLGRYYDESLHQIILPFDDEDELYAGSYFPRRFSGVFLSVEHLNYLAEDRSNSTDVLALVVAIFESQEEAEEYNLLVNKFSPSSFVQYASLYVGCMH
jgi:hypothetical protein